MQTVRNNLINNAPTTYTNFDFLSMMECHGVLIGAGASGLFKICCGADDDGVAIAAYFVTAKSDFGMGRKRARYAWFKYSGAGDMRISLTADDKTTIGPYAVTPEADEGAQRRRTKFGRGLKWDYGYFKVENVTGDAFALDSIKLVLQETSGGD